MALMTGLVLSGYGVLTLEQVERLEIPPGHVEIKVSYTGICGSDIHGFTGENGRRFPGQIMGHESEGLISGFGPGLDDFRIPIGTRVTFNPVVIPAQDTERFLNREQHSPNKFVIGVRPDYQAAFAEYILVPAQNIVPIDASAPEGAGALVEPLAVAVHAVNRSKINGGETALVCGGGPIGQSIVLALQHKGVHRIVVSEPNADRRKLVENLGASTINPLTSPSEFTEAVRDSLGGPAQVGFDAVGITETLSACLEAVELGGVVCMVGMGSPRVDVDAYAISTGERSIVGSFTYSHSAFLEAAAIISDKEKGIDALIGRVIGPDEAPSMFTQLAEGRGPAGKVLVKFGAVAPTEK